jgi:hypothetical protein
VEPGARPSICFDIDIVLDLATDVIILGCFKKITNDRKSLEVEKRRAIQTRQHIFRLADADRAGPQECIEMRTVHSNGTFSF